MRNCLDRWPGQTSLNIAGNWSRQEPLLLKGSYYPLVPWLKRLNVHQLVLEFATPRAGELAALLDDEGIRQSKELGLGVVNPRLDEIESLETKVWRHAWRSH